MTTTLFRMREGNLQSFAVASQQELEAAKRDGWKTTTELWPTPHDAKPEPKK
jgi:hypothetical protein